jgi:hypothetical protein
VLVTIATKPASAQAPNEDFVAATPGGVVLLDGVSTLGTPSGCTHGAAWYVRRLGGALLRRLAHDEGDTLPAMLAEAIREVARAHAGACDLAHPGTPSATVVLLRERGPQLEYLVLADSTAVFQHGDRLTVVTDDREAVVARRCRAAMDAAANGTPEHEAARRRFMRDMQAYRNRPGGFWVAAADPAAVAEAFTGSVPLDGLTAAAALTDGATRLVDRFGLADWTELMGTLARHGPGELIRQTRAAEHADPTGARWKRGKTTDDASVAYCAGPAS